MIYNMHLSLKGLGFYKWLKVYQILRNTVCKCITKSADKVCILGHGRNLVTPPPPAPDIIWTQQSAYSHKRRIKTMYLHLFLLLFLWRRRQVGSGFFTASENACVSPNYQYHIASKIVVFSYFHDILKHPQERSFPCSHICIISYLLTPVFPLFISL